ncbi:hypothetical protein TSTA_049620 [Talaromyces stipitatus ATCC 10500]|uniref:Uncharacterized protein n=1 Tax=Talaromyces stipitatus (strain ATCC 10500 / CBS 375.48 / QM 6759 / NRRL 1006) TaxID=441959 RepID=B8MLJ2_TALSN|nr:uncharacterized protein TSTA_049620 [Talaromyces stipitatus ATCC 10500]EED15525.1 hypothetical protein TSTA_049620 [Talaromyces stipitatus ATCC 10500]
MRGGVAQASIFLLSALAPIICHGLPTSTHAVTQDDLVLLWRDSDGIYVQFEASCASCSVHNEDVWPVNLFIGSRDGLCDNATVSVNGRELSHRWEGQSASGSGVIPSSPYNSSTNLRATWHSTCVTAPLSASPRGLNVRVFTFIYDTDRSHTLEDDVGFTISLGEDDEIEILRLSNFPVSFGDISNQGAWKYTNDNDAIDPDTGSKNSGISLDVKLETELQRLQVLQYELQQLETSVALQEKKIRQLLRQDCMPLLAKWQQCENFFCYLKSSWQKVPEFYWSIRYRFGLLAPGRITPICSPVSGKPSNPDHDTNGHKPSVLPSHAVPTPSKHGVPTSLGTALPSPSTIATPSTTTPSKPSITHPPPPKSDLPDTTPNHPDPNTTEVVLPIPIRSPTKEFFRSCAILLLVASIIGLFFRIIGHTTAFRRRRRDLASRREELRARRAYRNAARRLRWRQWWEGRSYFQAASVTSSHSLPEFHHVRGTIDSGEENRLTSRDIDNNDSVSDFSAASNEEEPEQRMMQAEILGLRRVLEYVGQLVGTDGTSTSARRRTRSRSRSVPPPYERINHSNNNNTLEIRRSVTPGVISASGGPGSPRGSTMFSLETGSLVTLETIDTLDSGTAPPSYHT